MSYQVLARKWRPKSFATLVGQEHVVRALTHALDQQRLHHAYLFTGTRGVGKTTIARIMAKALNCETGVTSTPCGQCASCQEIDGGRFVDYIELDAASNRGVDDMTQLLERATYAPTRGRYKVYVIDEVHQLSGHAFNAMLKTLEEPPEHVKFILATTDPQKIPVTVLSRCLQFNLKQMPVAHIVEHLERVLVAEGVPFDAGALRLLAKGAAGSMRDALSLLDQAIAHGADEVREAGVEAMLGSVGQDHLLRMLDALAAGDIAALVGVADALAARSLSFDGALQDLATLFHRIALLQLAPQAMLDASERETLAPYAEAFDAEHLQLCYQIVVQGRNELEWAPDDHAGCTMTLLRLAAFAPARAGEGRPAPRRAAAAPAPASREAPTAAPPAASAVPPPLCFGEEGASAPTTAMTEPTDDWGSLLARLSLAGLAKQLALHCQMMTRTSNDIQLGLSATHKHLLTKEAEERLRTAMRQHLGEGMRLVISLIDAVGDTPAQRARDAARERQERAIAAIEKDPIVRDLVERFDASIDEATIKPIQ